jgi:hypothetical protein
VKLSATYQPMEYLVHAAAQWVPGLLSVQAVYSDHGRIYHHDGEHKHVLSSENLVHIKLRKLRERKSRYTWVNNGFLSVESPSSQQLTVDAELDHRYLVLFVLNPTDLLSDVLLIEFPEHANPFRIKSGEIGLTTNEKEQLGAFLSTLANAEYSRIRNENALLSDFSKGIQRLNAENEALRKEIERLNQEKKNEFDQLLQTVSFDLMRQFQIEFSITSEAYHVLTALKPTVNELHQILERAVQLELIGQFGQRTIQLSTLYIQPIHEQRNPQLSAAQESKFDKIMLLLNKYEQAARELIDSGSPVNGKFIAHKLQVTPPALSDAIKKAASKINVLLLNYPEKWPLIRQFLKPIQRIEENRLSA